MADCTDEAAPSDAGNAHDAAFDASGSDAGQRDAGDAACSACMTDSGVDASLDAATDAATDALTDGGDLDAGAVTDPDGGASDGGATCNGFADVPIGAYDVIVHNDTYYCVKETLQCTLMEAVDAPAVLTIAGIPYQESPGDPVRYGLTGTLVAPGVDLDGVGSTSESYLGFIVTDPPSPNGAWDPASTATTVSVNDFVCAALVVFDPVGSIDITFDRALGQVTALHRRCEAEYLTIYYITETTLVGTGPLRCL